MSVNKLKSKPLSDIKTVKLKYIDDTISFDKVDYATSETFNFSFYDFLKNPNDITVNNYSYFFLSKKGLLSDQISYKQKKNETAAILTTLRFDYYSSAYFLYFESAATRESTVDSNVFENAASMHSSNALARQGITEKNITNYPGYLFIIEFISGTNKCYIKHISNSKEYYLYNKRILGSTGKYSTADTIAFTTNKDIIETFGKFTYIIDEDKISLSLVESELIYITVNSTNDNIWVHETHNIDKNTKTLKAASSDRDKCYYYLDDAYIGQTYTILKKVRIRSLINNSGVLTLADDRELEKPPAIFEQTENILGTTAYIDSAWLSYIDDSSLAINKKRSAFNLDNQYIYHLQYNNINPTDYSTTVNIIPLKNHVSPGNNIIRGDYLENDLNSETPNVNFREYTSLETGGIREFGNETIVLTYTYYNEEYTVKPGHDFIFTLQKNDDSLSGDSRFALYPYKQLNINNSQFINNGACGSEVPILADKVKKMQKNSAIFNNGRYLCTWLYQTPSLKHGIWLDRYYYPDRISKKESYYGTVKLNTEMDIIDKDYIYKNGEWNDTINTALGNAAYFDKQSDLVFEPGVTYTYSRIGEDEINSVLDNLNAFSIESAKTFTSSDSPATVDQDGLEKTGTLDMSFDMFINPDKTYGPCIISNSMINGFTITNEDNITPFIYTFNGSTIHLLNTDGELIISFNIEDYYDNDSTFLGISIDRPFKNIVAFTEHFIYLFSYDLILKKRIFLADKLLANNYKAEVTFKNTYFSITSTILSDNNLYLLVNNTVTADSTLTNRIPYDISRILRVDLISGEIYELNKYSSTGIYLETYDNGITLPKRKDASDKYPDPRLPLVGNSKVDSVKDNPDYSPDYWYFAPDFIPDIGNEPVNNASAIKSIYLQDGKLYAFPYHKIGRMQDPDLMYGVRQRTNLVNQVELIQLSTYELLARDTGSTNTAFKSLDTFTYFVINDNEDFILIKKKDDKDILMVFDSAKHLIRTTELQLLGYTEIFALDALKLYSNGHITNLFAGIAKHKDDKTGEISTRLIFIDNNGLITDKKLSVNVSTAVPYLINYNSIIANYKKGIKFNINIENRTGNIFEGSYIFDYSNVSAGWYNFRLIIDSNSDIFAVYCNDKPLTIHKQLDISKISNKHLFDNPIIIGTLNYKRNTSLSELLYGNKNTFNTENVKIKNFNLYNKVLSLVESQAVKLSKVKLQPVVITLPCGQKNNLEEIIRYFKFTPPPNISNTINIDIKHSGITDINVQKQLSIDILNKINNELLLPVTIKEINFI